MSLRGDNRFPDDVREVSSDCKIPIEADCTQRRTGNEAASDPKKTAHNADDESTDSEIDRADVRARNRKKHALLRATADQPQQKGRHSFQNHRLADDEQNCNATIDIPMVTLETVECLAQEMEDQEKVTGNQERVDGELKGKSQ
jgi:osmotically-inducible protein OsmY